MSDISLSATILTPRLHTTSSCASTDASTTLAPARRSTSTVMMASISSLPLPMGTRTVFTTGALREETVVAQGLGSEGAAAGWTHWRGSS
jgi:hypothetical protein